MRAIFDPAARQSSGDLLTDRLLGWAQASAAEGDHVAAADLFGQIVERAPDWVAGWFGLGESSLALGDAGRARSAFEHVLALDASDRLGAGVRLARMTNAQAPQAISAAHVASLFDQYAGRFDEHLTEALHYRGPQLLVEAVARIGATRAAWFDIVIDLGCGTGLAAKAFAGQFEHITGIDLSPAMIARAQSTGLYDRLIVADINAALQNETPASADLVLAADVLVYIGDLAPLFAGVARVLKSDGLFAFSVQRLEQGQWRLGEDLRYAHSDGYIRQMAAAAGFDIAGLDAASTRRDRGVDVPGLVVVCRRSAANSA